MRFVVAGAFAVAAGVYALPGRSQTSAPSTQPAQTGPITYYVASCARCHGDLTAAYLGLDHPKTGKVLEGVIDQMAEGPAQAPLDAEGLKQQTALHEAMFRKQPFMWIDPGRRDAIAGEALPETTVDFEAGGQRTPLTITDNHFETPRRPGTLIARRGGATVKTTIP